MEDKVICPACLSEKIVFTESGPKKCNYCDKEGLVEKIKESAFINELLVELQ